MRPSKCFHQIPDSIRPATFLAIGSISYLIYASTFYVAHNIWAWPQYICVISSYALTVAFHFPANRYLTFGDRRKNISSEFSRYIAVYALSGVIAYWLSKWALDNRLPSAWGYALPFLSVTISYIFSNLYIWNAELHDDKEGKKTIEDFGEQWIHYTDNSGFYGSDVLFKDIVEPLVSVDDFKNKTVLDIGSGTGRIITMLLKVGARRVTGIEPSLAYKVLQRNFGDEPRVILINAMGHEIPGSGKYDIAVSIGVLHHIVDPDPVVKAVYDSLEPGGRFIVWLYGWEGNELYIHIFSTVRRLTTRFPHALLAAFVWLLYFGCQSYSFLCRYWNLPMRDYVINVIGKMAPDKQRLIIYDQLNPHHAKYYRKSEALTLLRKAGFTNVRAFLRHGYSWTVVGEKPA